ncbi:MAG TPA: ABC transporter permease [Cytophagales bacterium]|jgi:putative ABC transport system permease protein|nr:ABC transporter permease [Cytophagales bacterium]
MFSIDKWEEIFYTIRQNKLRTFLTAFGVFWGILMLVMLLGAGQGLQNGIMADFSPDAVNSIWFMRGKTSLPYKGMPPGRSIRLTEEDLTSVKNNIDGIEYMSPENWLRGSFNIKHAGKSGPFTVYGVGKEYFNIKINQNYLDGRRLNFFDNIEARKVCIIGERVRDILFEEGAPVLDQYINIKDVNFKVVGVFKNDVWGGQFNERIYIPYATFQNSFNPSKNVFLFAITVAPGHRGKKVEQDVMDLLKARHTVAPDDREAFWTHNQEEDYNQVMGLFTGIKGLVWFVGMGTLLAGIIGISNIMIIIVKDRTKEIGIRKAIGATPWSIVSMILLESVFITAIAGYIGLCLGVFMIEGINMLIDSSGGDAGFFRRPEINLNVAVTALIILVMSGALAGLVPAIKASKVKPIEALRSE